MVYLRVDVGRVPSSTLEHFFCVSEYIPSHPKGQTPDGLKFGGFPHAWYKIMEMRIWLKLLIPIFLIWANKKLLHIFLN